MTHPSIKSLFLSGYFARILSLCILGFGIMFSAMAQPESQNASAEGASRGERGPLDTRISTIYYETGKIKLDDPANREVRRVIRLMRMNPAIRLSIQGHTDDQGDVLENQRLSEYRAWLVWAYMVANGVPHHRIEFVGFGFRKPKVGETTEEARKENRRVEVHLIMGHQN